MPLEWGKEFCSDFRFTLHNPLSKGIKNPEFFHYVFFGRWPYKGTNLIDLFRFFYTDGFWFCIQQFVNICFLHHIVKKSDLLDGLLHDFMVISLKTNFFLVKFKSILIDEDWVRLIWICLKSKIWLTFQIKRNSVFQVGIHDPIFLLLPEILFSFWFHFKSSVVVMQPFLLYK